MSVTPPSAKRVLAAGTALAASLLPAGAGPSVAPPTPHHVVLIHGIWDNARTLRKMDAALRARGFETTVVALTPNDGRLPLEAYAEQVHAQTRERLPARGRFSVVGFSMGGLVARAYLRHHVTPDRLHAFVSIASPHRGTWLAYLRNLPGIRDMRPGSPLLAALDADAARFATCRWLTIRTPLDLMILPSNSCSLTWARNECVLAPLHALLVLDGRVIRHVLAALNE